MEKGRRASPFQSGGHSQTPVAVRSNSYQAFKEYSELVNNQSSRLCTLRGLMELKSARAPVPIEEVEPAADIVKRFKTGAMSYGSISKEAHEALAVAMNRIEARAILAKVARIRLAM